MKLYFARHAESEANVEQIISNRGQEYGLTPEGYSQARTLAEQFADVELAGIFCSPLRRALETAREVAELTGAPVAVADGLREVDCGILEGKGDEEAWHELGKAFRQWLEFGHPEYAIPEGENALQVQARFSALAQTIARAGGTGSYLFISHAGTLRLGLPALLAWLPAERFAGQFLDYGEYVLAEAVDGEFTCLEWRGEKINQEEI
jgi:probable phosphoglycerate mutase